MMTVLELDRKKPRLIRLLLHQVRMRVPTIEIAHEGNRLGLRRIANEVHGAQVVFPAVTVHSHKTISSTKMGSGWAWLQ